MPTWECKLSDFAGPMDLLLELVKREKIDLMDIFVSEITDQYLKYMEQINDVDMDKASEFLNVAALLLYIKSRSLLPSKKEEKSESDFADSEIQLITKLREYQKYKEAAGCLQNLAKDAAKTFFKMPNEFFEVEYDWKLADANIISLYNIFNFILERDLNKKAQYSEIKIFNDSESVQDQKKRLLDFVYRNKRVDFFDFFDYSTPKLQIVVTFFAMLELWHECKLSVAQSNPFNHIILSYNNNNIVLDNKI